MGGCASKLPDGEGRNKHIHSPKAGNTSSVEVANASPPPIDASPLEVASGRKRSASPRAHGDVTSNTSSGGEISTPLQSMGSNILYSPSKSGGIVSIDTSEATESTGEEAAGSKKVSQKRSSKAKETKALPVATEPLAPPSSAPAAPGAQDRPKDTKDSLSRAHLMVPKQGFAEKYDTQEFIGKGNYAVVYAVKDLETGVRYAAKIMKKEGLSESDIKEIKEEVSILAELQHPNIISLIGFYDDETQFYIVTELMEGGELFDEIVEREVYWERDAQEVVKTLADAVKYMHSLGIVHRDLKPENVLLTTRGPSGVVKIADFGFATRIDVNSSEYQLSTACGTPSYVAPEIVVGLRYGTEVDCWSLGVIAFVLLSGYPPFHDDDVQELFRQIRKGKYYFDPQYWSVVSDEAKHLVRSLMNVDRRVRLNASQILEHPWIASVTEEENEKIAKISDQIQAPVTALLGGVGGRSEGGTGRGPEGSVNLSPALLVLRKFQARRRWKDLFDIALIREGQMIHRVADIEELLSGADQPAWVKVDRTHHISQGPGVFDPAARRVPFASGVDDLTQLGGLGTSAVLPHVIRQKKANMRRADAV